MIYMDDAVASLYLLENFKLLQLGPPLMAEVAVPKVSYWLSYIVLPRYIYVKLGLVDDKLLEKQSNK